MNSEQFVGLLKEEVEDLQSYYSQGKAGETYIGAQIEALPCTDDIKTKVLELVNEAVKENLYVLLSALEGSSALAGVQQRYKILDENDKLVSGELDSEYYMQILENE